jgi:serine/threonine-protein phosphatase 2A regulatory subunit B'
VKALSGFHTQLTYCMTQFIAKDPRLTEVVITGMLKYWPVTNTPKEVLFLNELEEILFVTQTPEFVRVQIPLFSRIAKCILSPHFQVSKVVLYIFFKGR